MRFSNYYLPTIKDTPNDAEVISHQLMLRAGMIRKLASGLYTWLPIGLKVLRKVEKIVREEMNALGAQEIFMPALQPAELWEETARWDQYGATLLKIQDRHKREFCYGPTHEEIVTDLVRHEVKSYKQLPLILYQIQTKFRDEIRPRFGVMRAREFIMKDAYSFHVNDTSLENTYQAMYKAYNTIFSRLGLKFRAVLADTGNIGGSASHEFQVLADSGEDRIAYSTESDYAANIEFATAKALELKRPPAKDETHFVTTPNLRTVEEQAKHLHIPTSQILKTLLVKGRTADKPIVALLVRGDHQLNTIKAEKHPLVAYPLTMINTDELKKVCQCGPGFVGPVGLNIPIIADFSVLEMANFVCGANKEDTHYAGFNWERDCPLPEGFDLREVVEGDFSPDGRGSLKLTRGIEVGHIFQLGTKYSEAMKATVLDENGKAIPLKMGCYGIGVSRIVAAAIEQNHDEKGIIWSSAMAPFQVILIPLSLYKSEMVRKIAEKFYQEFLQAGIEVLLDDRDLRAGVMFSEAELLGIPHRIVISDKTLEQNKVEYQARTSQEKQYLELAEVLDFVKKHCK